jgi:hypothetical protein
VIPALREADRHDADREIPAPPGADQHAAALEIFAPREAGQRDADQPARDASADQASAYEGWVDGLIDDRVCGWCWRIGSPHPVSLELSVDDQRVATFVAMDRRDDLERLGIGNGRHGFFSPTALRGIPPNAVIKLKVLGTDIEVPGSGRSLSEYPQL